MQERARKSQRIGSEFDDGFSFPDDRNSAGLDSKAFKDLVRLPGPPLPLKDTPAAAPAAAQKARTGLGKFGRLGGGAGKAKK